MTGASIETTLELWASSDVPLNYHPAAIRVSTVLEVLP